MQPPRRALTTPAIAHHTAGGPIGLQAGPVGLAPGLGCGGRAIRGRVSVEQPVMASPCTAAATAGRAQTVTVLAS